MMKDFVEGLVPSTAVDNILIDLANVAAWTGNKRIILTGTAQPRTSASNAAVATLTALGVSVTTN